MNDICCIGHITLDKIVTPRKTTYMPGGTSYYFSHGISHLKDTKHYQLVTALAPSEFKAVEDIRAKYIDILKVNEHEMEVLTGQTDIKQAALQLAEWGVKEVLITLGSLGSIIYAEGTFHKIPAYPPKDIVDATGCGDTYATGYLYMRNKGASYEEAGCFAAAMSTLKLEASGPFSKTEEDVWNIIRTSSLKAEKI